MVGTVGTSRASPACSCFFFTVPNYQVTEIYTYGIYILYTFHYFIFATPKKTEVAPDSPPCTSIISTMPGLVATLADLRSRLMAVKLTSKEPSVVLCVEKELNACKVLCTHQTSSNNGQ